MRHCIVLLLLLPCLFTSAASATPDSTLILDLQMRVRSEWRDGYQLASVRQTGSILNPIQRSRVGVSGSLNDMQFKLQLQSVRSFFGRPSGSDQGSYSMSLSETWVQMPLRNNLRLKLGRQKVAFDDERVVGAIDWSNAGRFLDGISLLWETNQGVTSAVFAWDEWADTRRWMLHHEKSWKQHRASFLLFDQHSSTEPSALTAGGTWTWSSDQRTAWRAEAYGQFHAGQYRGHMLVAEGQKTGADGGAWKWGCDLLSGGQDQGPFRPFLGTNHKFYGWMDHFYVGAETDGLLNLRLERKTPVIQEKAVVGATFHHFRNHNGSELLGNELDLWITGKNRHGIQWHLGWSAMDPTENHTARQGALSESEWADAANRLQQWGWISVNFNPSILLR